MDNVVQLYRMRKEGKTRMYRREVAVTKNKTVGRSGGKYDTGENATKGELVSR